MSTWICATALLAVHTAVSQGLCVETPPQRGEETATRRTGGRETKGGRDTGRARDVGEGGREGDSGGKDGSGRRERTLLVLASSTDSCI